MSPTSPDRIDHIEQVIEEQTKALSTLTEEVKRLNVAIAELKEEFKGWNSWLRTASGIVIFSVALTVLGLVLPLAVALWRESLV